MLAVLLAFAGAWASARYVHNAFLAVIAGIGVGVLSSAAGAALLAMVGHELFSEREIAARAIGGLIPYTTLAVAVTLALRWIHRRGRTQPDVGRPDRGRQPWSQALLTRGGVLLHGLARRRLSRSRCLSGAAIGILLTLLFPPFVLELNGATFGLGWGFLFDGPKYQGRIDGIVNVPLLITEWVAIVLVAGIGWLYTKVSDDR